MLPSYPYIIFGSDANSIRNLCSPVGVCVYVCMWTCRGIATGDRNKSIPVHGCLNNGEQLVPGWERLLCRLD